LIALVKSAVKIDWSRSKPVVSKKLTVEPEPNEYKPEAVSEVTPLKATPVNETVANALLTPKTRDSSSTLCLIMIIYIFVKLLNAYSV
jgi:hypothetical protein